MNKRFSFVFTITLVIVSLAFAQNQASAQYFNKYYTWASEKHMWPGEDRGRLPFAYENINLVVKGNFSGFQYHGVNIPALVYLVENKYNIFEIYAVESRGFRTYDPIFSYGSPGLIQQQEGIALDSIGIIINGETALDQAYTEHPTVRRFRDQNNNFPNFDSIKFAVSGNFFGSRKDEIMLVYNNPNGQQQFYFFKVNQPGDTLNYQFEIDTGKTIKNIKTYLDVQHVIHAEAGNFDNV